MVEAAHMKRPAACLASEDVFIRIPNNILANILERVPIHDAVKTSILSRSWRFKWTMIEKLLLDQAFFEYLKRKELISQYGKIVNRALLHLKGSIMKFSLHIPPYCEMYNEDISHWIMFLSRNGLKEFSLINMHQEPFMLPTHLFSCLELKYLKLHNCHLCPAPGFTGFPELVGFEFYQITLDAKTSGKFVAGCPLLESLTIREHSITGQVYLFPIPKLKYLKLLCLSLSKLDSFGITIPSVLDLVGSFPKLEELYLDFEKTSLYFSGGVKRFRTTFRSLKILAVGGVNFYDRCMVLCVSALIRGSPKLQKLEITAMNEDYVSKLAFACEDRTMEQLEIVKLNCIQGLKTELCLIKFLLACSPSLKKMVINLECSGCNVGDTQALAIARELLKFHRASPHAEIEF